MGNETDILSLASSFKGKSAAYITETLSAIGNNSMAEGISRVVDSSIKFGFKKGVFWCISGTSVVLGTTIAVLYFCQKRIAQNAVLQKANVSDTEPSQAGEETICCNTANENNDKSTER